MVFHVGVCARVSVSVSGRGSVADSAFHVRPSVTLGPGGAGPAIAKFANFTKFLKINIKLLNFINL